MRWLLPAVLFTDACALENTLGENVDGVAGDDSRADTAAATGDTAPPEPSSCSASPAWELEVAWTSRLELSVPFGGVVVGPLTNGGPPAVVVASPGSGVVAYAGVDGAQLWQHSLPSATETTAPALGDLDGDGAAEVLLSSEDGLFILDGASGALLASSEPFQPFCAQGPVVADLDGDGHAELVVLEAYQDDAAVVVYRDRDGFVDAQPIWNQHAYNVRNVTADGSVPENPVSNWPHPNIFRASTCPD